MFNCNNKSRFSYVASIYVDKMFYFLLTQRILLFMSFFIILCTKATATTCLIKHVFNNNKVKPHF